MRCKRKILSLRHNHTDLLAAQISQTSSSNTLYISVEILTAQLGIRTDGRIITKYKCPVLSAWSSIVIFQIVVLHNGSLCLLIRLDILITAVGFFFTFNYFIQLLLCIHRLGWCVQHSLELGEAYLSIFVLVCQANQTTQLVFAKVYSEYGECALQLNLAEKPISICIELFENSWQVSETLLTQCLLQI